MSILHKMTDRETALHCLAGIDPRGLGYDEWLGVGMALKKAGATAADWESWSRGDSARFNDGECAKRWAGFNGEGVGVGTLVKMYRDAGGVYPPPAGDIQRASAPLPTLPPVSYFNRCTETTGRDAPLAGLLDDIRSGKYAAEVEAVRAAVAGGKSKRELQALKAATLPAFTGAGTFTTRKSENLAHHSGMILLDVDGLPDAAAAERMRDVFAADSCTVAAFVSPAGWGARPLCGLTLPPTMPNTRRHSARWLDTGRAGA